MRVFSIGRSADKFNEVSDRRDPRDVLVVELAENVDDREAFAAKRQVLSNCTIHGDERAGGEAAPRFIEGVLRGEYASVEALLDELALIFTFVNPDGWAARRPQYESYGVPGAPLHERGNLGGDTNRQFPNPGWVSAAHTIAEPLGATLDGETAPPDYVAETTPDMLAFVEHCRSYENLVCGIDLHGMLSSKDFVLALDGASQSSTDELQNSFELIEAIGTRITENLPEWEAAGEALSPVTDQFNPSVFGLSAVPEQAFNFGTPVETIGYSGTGFVDEWFAFPEELGGLGIPSLTMEMAYSNIVGGNVYDQARVGMQVDGYRGAILGAIDYATRDVDGRFDGNGDVAYVTTDELTARATDLPHVDDEDDAVAYDPSRGGPRRRRHPCRPTGRPPSATPSPRTSGAWPSTPTSRSRWRPPGSSIPGGPPGARSTRTPAGRSAGSAVRCRPGRSPTPRRASGHSSWTTPSRVPAAWRYESSPPAARARRPTPARNSATPSATTR